jgi:hypothetical protein
MTTKSILICLFILPGCQAPSIDNNYDQPSRAVDRKTAIHSIGNIPLPEGYRRTVAGPGSFANWLRQIHLKEDNTVYMFNGRPKENQSAQYAVLDISVGDKDLQQCADAVMRLRAEYLFSQARFNEIIFWDNVNVRYAFVAPYTREHFASYLQQVFGMCGSASLAQQLTSKKNLMDINPGDVLIRGGFPGHAVMVTDVAEDSQGKKIYQLVQSYMPAQDLHVLKNPVNHDLSPWYEITDDLIIYTPEYTFKKTEWKEW